jgi:hypothetical protein
VNVCITALKNMPNRPCLSKKKYFIASATGPAIHYGFFQGFFD